MPDAELPSDDAWLLFWLGWGGVVDHYMPSGTGPWPLAIIGTIAVLAPLGTRETKPAAPPTPATPTPPRVGAQLGKACYELHARGERDHPTQTCPHGCECACHQGLPA